MRTRTRLCRGSYLVPVAGTRLHVTVAGRESGPVLLYLHGGAGHYAGDFQHFAGPAVEELGQVIYLDQRGCGASPPTPSGYSMARLVTDLDELYHQMGARPWHLVAHSFGGLLAVEYAMRHPEQVASLFLISTAVEMAEAVASRLQRGLNLLAERDPAAARTLQQVLEDRNLSAAQRYLRALPLLGPLWELVFAQPESERHFHDVLKAHHFATNVALAGALLDQGLLQHSIAPALAELRHPLTALYGREDPSLYDHQARRLAQVRPDATVLALRESGHFVYVEQPERLARHLSEHLARAT